MSPEDTAELEELVFDLVRSRLLEAVGAGGMWTLQFRTEADTDVIFGETIAEVIARDVAGHIAIPEEVQFSVADDSPEVRIATETPSAETVPIETVRDVVVHRHVHARLVA